MVLMLLVLVLVQVLMLTLMLMRAREQDRGLLQCPWHHPQVPGHRQALQLA